MTTYSAWSHRDAAERRERMYKELGILYFRLRAEALSGQVHTPGLENELERKCVQLDKDFMDGT